MIEAAKTKNNTLVRLVLTLIAALGLLLGSVPVAVAQDEVDAGLAIEDYGPETEIPLVAEGFLDTAEVGDAGEAEDAVGVEDIGAAEGTEPNETESVESENAAPVEESDGMQRGAPMQTADGRTEVWCAPGPPGEVCTPDELVKRIDEAGTTPTRIVVRGTVSMPETLVIPAGADIELVNIDGRNMIITTIREFKGPVIEVEEGGSLTFSKNESDHLPYVLGQNHWNGSSAILIDVKGTLVLNAGKIYGARNMSGTHQGAITVSGESAYFEMNGGEVSENRRKDDPSTTQNGAANIAVVDGAKMRMNGGVVQKGLAAKKAAAYGEVGGIGVYDGGRLEINGGAIRGNTGFAGGIAAYSWDWDLAKHPERSESQRSIIYLNDGVIDDNHAGFGGGGALVYGNAELIMNGGEIKNNTAPNGGGVNAMDLFVNGASGSYREIPGDGMNAGYTAEKWSDISPGSFIMKGGTISGNSSTRTGGGVNVVSNGVLLQGGSIADNHADGQGGGVYVATRSYVLQLENVLVNGNEATGQGGGIWLCPTGSAEIHVTEGGAVFGNEAERYGDDFAHDNLGTQGRPEVELANRMLGLGEVQYFKDGDDVSITMEPDKNHRYDPADPGREQVYQGEVPVGEQDPRKDYKLHLFQEGLKQVSTESDRDKARGLAALTITGNSSVRGGGIGSNGGLIIGYEDQEIPVEKAWIDRNGIEMTEDLPESIEVSLWASYGGQKVQVGETVEITPDDEGNWSHIFRDLPYTISGQVVTYSIEEQGVPGFRTIVAKENKDGKITFRIANKQQDTGVTVQKVWLDGNGEEMTKWIPDSIEVALMRWDGDQKVPVHLDDQGNPQYVTLKADSTPAWSYTFADLPLFDNGERIAYDVLEKPIPGFESSTSVTKADDDTYVLRIENRAVETEVVVEKTWTDEDGKSLAAGDVPESITVSLMRWVGDEKVAVEGHQNVKLTAADGWRHTFKGLPLYIGGELVAYDIDEVSVDGFTQTTSVERTEKGYLLHLENSADSTEVIVEKQWRDADGGVLKEDLPESIQLQLVRIDGEDVFTVGGPVTVKVDDEGKWSHTFADLAKFFDGERARYSVVEVEVPGYSSKVEVTEKDGRFFVTVTNVKDDTPPDNPPEDPEEPPVTPPEDPEDPPSTPPVVPPVTPPGESGSSVEPGKSRSQGLATTGASVYGVVGVALLLVLSGAVLLAERRRKLES